MSTILKQSLSSELSLPKSASPRTTKYHCLFPSFTRPKLGSLVNEKLQYDYTGMSILYIYILYTAHSKAVLQRDKNINNVVEKYAGRHTNTQQTKKMHPNNQNKKPDNQSTKQTKIPFTTTRYNTTRHDMTRQDATRRTTTHHITHATPENNTAQRNTPHHITSHHNTTQHDTTHRNTTHHNIT